MNTPTFSISFKHGAVSLTLTATIEERDLLLPPEPGRENTERLNDICCAAISRSAQQIAALATSAQLEFSQALDRAVLADYRSYLETSNVELRGGAKASLLRSPSRTPGWAWHRMVMMVYKITTSWIFLYTWFAKLKSTSIAKSRNIGLL